VRILPFPSVSCGKCDLQDDYRIILFEGSEGLNSRAQLKSHLILTDGPNWPSDQFLRLHFRKCLAVSVCRGDVMEDYKDQEIENFMEDLGVYDGEIDTSDPRWSTPLGSHVHAYLSRQKMAEGSVYLFVFSSETLIEGLFVVTCMPARADCLELHCTFTSLVLP
jgi:hypothetical protein